MLDDAVTLNAKSSWSLSTALEAGEKAYWGSREDLALVLLAWKIGGFFVRRILEIDESILKVAVCVAASLLKSVGFFKFLDHNAHSGVSDIGD